MARLSGRDEARAADVAASIAELEDRGPGAIDLALPMLRELLNTPIVSGYRLRSSDGGRAELDYLKFRGLPLSEAAARGVFERFFDRMVTRRGFHDPVHPQRKQRNRVVTLPGAREDVAKKFEPVADRYGLPRQTVQEAAETMWELEACFRSVNLPAHDQLRVLLCEGDTLLAWVGALQPEPFAERQRLLLKRVAAPLRKRLIVERRIGGAGLEHAAMVAALEHIPAAAFLLDGHARVVHANAVGRHRLETQKRATQGALAKALERKQGQPPEMVSTKLSGPGLPPLHLVVAGARGDRVRFAIERASSRWQLTERETQVLAELAAGRSNRDAADQLDASVRTIELHVSSIFRKADADTRSELIIDLWHLADAP